MYRVLVVEDEALLRQGLCDELNKMNCFDVCCAENGMEALEQLRTRDIDGVVMDIKMPEMDGIELLERMSEEGIEPIIIILSGYDEFEYAQKAIKYGVREYIVKPFTPATVRSIGETLRRNIDKNNMEKEKFSVLAKQQDAGGPGLRKQLLGSIVAGIATNTSTSQVDFSGLEFPHGLYQVAVFKNSSDNTEISALRVVFQAISEKIAKALSDDIDCDLFSESPETLAAVFNFKEHIDLFGICERTLLSVSEGEAGAMEGLNIVGGISTVHDCTAKLRDAYIEALEASRYNVAFAHIPLLSYQDISQDGELMQLLDEDRVINMCRVGMTEELIALSREYVETISRRSLLLENVYLAAEYVANLCCRTAFSFTKIDISSMRESIREEKTLGGVLVAMEEIIISACTEIKEIRKGVSSYSVERAVLFIEDNYHKPISVEDVAVHVELSANYIGRLFKQHQGVSIREFLNRVRVDAACELMTASNKKNYEIAYAVGYNDPNYFSIVFKKITGVSPKQYRETSITMS